MPSIIFRGAYLRMVDIRQSPNGEAVFVRAAISCDFSDKVMEAMEWADLPACYGEGKLPGELNASQILFKPNGKELKAHAFQLNVKRVDDFKVVSLVQPDGKPNKRELRFVIRTSEPGAGQVFENYLTTVGQGLAQLTVSYSEQGNLLDASQQTPADQSDFSDLEGSPVN